MFSSPFIVPVVLFVSLAAVAIMRGPFGRALADRIAGRTAVPRESDERTLAELDELRRRLAEVEERLDFTERLLARERRASGLPPGP
jgi:hypothetical protein